MCTRPSSQLALATLVGQLESARVHSFGAGESHGVRVERSRHDGSLCATRSDCAAASRALATSERTVGKSTSARDRLLEYACECGDVATVKRLLV